MAVYDHHITGSPGYRRKVLSVVWDDAPSFFDVFTWEGDTMVRRGRECDENECCGAKNAGLCVNCWRRWDRQTTPDLYEAVYGLLGLVEDGRPETDRCPEVRAARAALDRAEGRRREGGLAGTGGQPATGPVGAIDGMNAAWQKTDDTIPREHHEDA